MAPSAEFLVRGGTSMGLLSASSSRAVAERYAAALSPLPSAASSASSASSAAQPPVAALLLKLIVPNERRHGGAPIAFLSCFPEEEEVLYAPGTYLRPAGRPYTLVSAAVTAAGGGGRVAVSLNLFRVLEVVPLPRSDAD